MKPIKRAALAAAMALAVSAPGFAADTKTKPPRAATRPPANKLPMAPAPADSLIGQVVYQVLLGEIALQRGEPGLAVSVYADLAYRTRDPRILERTVEVATIARRFDVAYEATRIWIEVAPDSITAQQTLAAILIMQNRLDELGPQISLLLELEKEDLPANLLRLNRMLSRVQDKAAVYRLLEPVLAPYAGVAEAHFALATAAFHAGDRASALMEVRKAATLRPDWETAALFEAQLLSRESSVAAVEVLSRFVEAHPKARDVRLNLARALVAEKRYDDARQHFDRLLADEPDNTELLYPVAVLALQQGDAAAAEPLLRKLLARGDLNERSVAAYYLGQVAEERKDGAEAIALYEQVAPGEHFVPAHVRIANLMLKSDGGLTMARTHLQGAARRFPPGAGQLQIAEAHLLRDAGQTGEAMALLDAVVAGQPNSPELLYDAALLAEKLGRMELVEHNLRRVIELRPDSAHAYNALGYSFADRGVRLDEARELIAKAQALAPDDPFIMDSMGWLLYRQGDAAGAIDVLRKAYTLKQDAEIAAHLGEVLWSVGRADEAAEVVGEASRRHPESDVLKAIRQKLGR